MRTGHDWLVFQESNLMTIFHGKSLKSLKISYFLSHLLLRIYILALTINSLMRSEFQYFAI